MTTKTTKTKLLVVDDNEVFRGALKTTLEEAGFQIEVAENGRRALELVGVGGFRAVVSDIRMTPVDGIELLKHVKERIGIPVILMTGFAEILETQQAHELGAAGFLTKPFKSDDLLKMLSSILTPDEAEKPQPMDDKFCKVAIEDFVSGLEIKYDIFVRLSEVKYIKIARAGDNIPIDRIKALKTKGLTHLYMSREDFKKYVGFNVMLSNKVSDSNALDNERKFAIMKHTQDLIQEEIYNGTIDQQTFEHAKTVVETTTALLIEANDTSKMLAMLNGHVDTLYAHSLGVSMYGVMIAKEMKWTTPNVLFRIAMGGMLHDIGKKEIDKKILTKTRGEMTPEEVKEYESHPTRGAQILSKIPSIPADVLQIVLQHHELLDGSGFPGHLRRDKIHPLARLITVANEFAKFVIRGPNNEKMSPNEALVRIKLAFSEQVDRAFLAALCRAHGDFSMNTKTEKKAS